ncbi:hypothetical protein GWN26_09110 [Candidatus Saccharibacteria bacterium]|nr:hypothetical protein [Candidatus Saccharibacteria bacterium]
MIRAKKNSTPEKTLWAHVIIQAIEDLEHKPTPSCTNINGRKYKSHCDKCYGKHHAKWWIKYSQRGFTSFPHLCEIVGMDPEIIRQGLKERNLI